MRKISIITVCFNSAGTIGDTIDSVLSQDYPDIEYIIVDGASEDKTMDIVRSYGDKIDVVISESDSGIYDAMNKGIRIASGDVVGFLNSDDFYSSNQSVTHLMARMEESGSDAVFADLVIVDPDDTERVIRYYDSSGFHTGRLRYGWMPAHPTLLVKREIYEAYGGFSLQYRIAADFEMVVRLFYTNGISYAYLPATVIKMRHGGLSNSGLKNTWLLNQEIVRACKANNLDTNIILLFSKLPGKLMEYIRKPA